MNDWYSHGIKSHQFCCFQSVSWGGASQGGRINFRCTINLGIEIILNIIRSAYSLRNLLS